MKELVESANLNEKIEKLVKVYFEVKSGWVGYRVICQKAELLKVESSR